MLLTVGVTCLLVDDSRQFLETASRLLERDGLSIVGTATTGSEALARVRELHPELAIVDFDLGGESGFDLAWQIAEASAESQTRIILTSTHSESDFAELIAVTPVLGFIAKIDLSAQRVRDFLDDRNHGHGCRHEALVYSSTDELVAASVPFLRDGLASGDDALVVLREPGRLALQAALGGEAGRTEFWDAVPWYQSPQHAFEGYTRYLNGRMARGAPRVRIVAEVIWPNRSATTEIAGWKRYEAKVSTALASVPVSYVCTYDTRELTPEIVMDARRTHPILRTADGALPSSHYTEPARFIRALEHDVPEVAGAP